MGYYNQEKFLDAYKKDPKNYDKLLEGLDTVINKTLKKVYKRVVGHMGRDDMAQDIRIHLWKRVFVKGYINDMSPQDAFSYCIKVIKTQAFRLRKQLHSDMENNIEQVRCSNIEGNLFGVSSSVGINELMGLLYDVCGSIHHGRRVLSYLTDPDSEYSGIEYAGLQINKFYAIVRRIKKAIKEVAYDKEQVDGNQVGSIPKR